MTQVTHLDFKIYTKVVFLTIQSCLLLGAHFLPENCQYTINPVVYFLGVSVASLNIVSAIQHRTTLCQSSPNPTVIIWYTKDLLSAIQYYKSFRAIYNMTHVLQ